MIKWNMYRKTSKQEILKLIEDDIIIYLRSGKLCINKFLGDINLNINGLDKLLKIHFLLDKDVKNYILQLKKNILKFNTSTIKQPSLTRGKIKGNVSWSKTIQVRNNINPKDKTIFICNENYKNFNNEENLILKTFLQIIYNILKEEDINKYFSNEWAEDGELLNVKRVLEKIYSKNIYISKINLKHQILDDRIIERVLRNRNTLYKEAARLLKYYKKVMKFDKEEMKKLLRTTFIEIIDEATLFELYWTLKIIKDNAKNETLNILDGKSEKVAQWEEKKLIYNLYHNSTGSEEVSFNVKVDEIREIDNEFIKRKIKSIDQTNVIAKELFNGIKKRYNYVFNGRPDILIEIRDKYTYKLNKIIICEVKHTIDKDYSIEGLKELIEYINFIKQKTNNEYEYVKDTIEIKGILFLDNIKINNLINKDIQVITISDNKKIKINF